jgi:hypothetical protein
VATSGEASVRYSTFPRRPQSKDAAKQAAERIVMPAAVCPDPIAQRQTGRRNAGAETEPGGGSGPPRRRWQRAILRCSILRQESRGVGGRRDFSVVFLPFLRRRKTRKIGDLCKNCSAIATWTLGLADEIQTIRVRECDLGPFLEAQIGEKFAPAQRLACLPAGVFFSALPASGARILSSRSGCPLIRSRRAYRGPPW